MRWCVSSRQCEPFGVLVFRHADFVKPQIALYSSNYQVQSNKDKASLIIQECSYLCIAQYSAIIGLTHNSLKVSEPMGLRELRKKRGLTQVQLAKQTGIAQTIISRYERGEYDVHNMTLDNALRISRALGCHPYELTDGWPE